MGEPPVLPTIDLPGAYPLAGAPVLPRAILSIPHGEAPSYVPLLAPPKDLKPPKGIASEEEEAAAAKPPPPEVSTITIPFVNHELPVPKEEIVVAAGMTAAVSVVATLTATSMFNQVVKVLKPVFMQVVKRVQKKFGAKKDGSDDESSDGSTPEPAQEGSAG